MATHICKGCGSAFTHNYRGRPPVKCPTCRAANGQEIKSGNRENRFAGSCSKCGSTVPAKGGFAINAGGHWIVTHRDGGCPTITIGSGDSEPEIPKVENRAIPGAETLPKGTVDSAIAAMVEAMTANVRVDTDGIKSEVLSHVDNLLPDLIMLHGVRRVEMTIDGVNVPMPDVHHRDLPTLITVLRAGLHVFMPGPAGSGKSTLAMQASEALGLPFGSISFGPTTPTSKMFGYQDATGNYVTTEFRKTYACICDFGTEWDAAIAMSQDDPSREEAIEVAATLWREGCECGGIFLGDEIDNGHPGLVAELNQALANPYCAFADRMVRRGRNFRFVATGNTFGKGADRLFVGRNTLDAATLDRFFTLEVMVDETLERRIAGAYSNPDDPTVVTRWIDYVQSVRRKVTKAALPVVVSPRSAIDGAKLLAIGMDWDAVVEGRLFAGIKAEVRDQIS